MFCECGAYLVLVCIKRLFRSIEHDLHIFCYLAGTPRYFYFIAHKLLCFMRFCGSRVFVIHEVL